VRTLTSERVKARVIRDFGAAHADVLLAQLDALELPLIGEEKEGLERVQAAILLAARGDRDRFSYFVELAEVDWRDVLVAGGLADEDWADRMLTALGSESNGMVSTPSQRKFIAALPLIGSLTSLLLIGFGIFLGGFMGGLLVGLGLFGLVNVVTVAAIRAALKRRRAPPST
jgi:hypothetical protein